MTSPGGFVRDVVERVPWRSRSGTCDGAWPHLAPGDEEFTRTMAEKVAPPQGDIVPTYGDFQLRALHWDGSTEALYAIGAGAGGAVMPSVRPCAGPHGG
ncbi:hypothetical protein [Streptomyces griseoluteus]|uniref:hypothetical protein n=1 Tax=Streptomyces griseoluteus TaxID=29306 RepID=UPI0037019ED7